MQQVDYIIVGDGYAALFVAHQLIQNRKTFLLFSEGKKSASQVSAGIINPAVLKKFTTFWKAQEQLDYLRFVLSEIESYTEKNYRIDEPIHRIFHDENERNLWLKKSENEELKPFLSREFKTVEGVENPYATGQILQSARLDVSGFFRDMLSYLEANNYLVQEKFNYDWLDAEASVYDGRIAYGKIVFAEGMAVKFNPFFSEIPVQPNKGHHLKVVMPETYSQKITLKKKHFLFPLADSLFYYGGTYDREQQDEKIDEKAVEQLENGLTEFYKGSYTIQDKVFGFRPTVKDRRPILGAHPKYSNLYVFNGLGARGILNGSYFSEILFRHTESGTDLPPEVDLKRFEK